MSVLQRKELEDSPLADIHAIASELGIEGYRALRREDLIGAILGVQGGDAPAPREEPDGEPEEEPAAKPKRRRGSRAKAKKEDPEDDAPSADPGPGDDAPPVPEAKDEAPVVDSKDDADDGEHEAVTGILDVQANGSGFLHREDGPDVYVSPAQIRRCELRAGDEVDGPVRAARRNERHPSLVRVDAVNGRDPEPPEQRPSFDELTAVHPTERLAAPGQLDGVPFGKGSRVAVSGPSGAGATRLLREIVANLGGQAGDLVVSVVLVGVRPEEVTDWRREASVPVSGGSFDLEAERQGRAAVLAVERAKRVAERGGDAVVVIDSLQALAPDLARRVFGAARKLEEGGSLTVFAAVGDSSEQLRLASTRIVLEAGPGEPAVAADRSGAQRADLLG